MTPDEFRDVMAEIAKGADDDTEMAHCDGDQLMIAVLRELGYDEGCIIFERMKKWYA